MRSAGPTPISPFCPNLSSANDEQDAGYDGEDGHRGAQIREAQIDQRNDPGQDEPHSQQQQSDASFHCLAPFDEA
jgi:hypothetical protein